MKHRFYGGIHPQYNKEMSTADRVLHAIVPKQVVIPMQQHIGSPCIPLVKPGERVLLGQKIGDGDGLCVPVHSSVSGTVIAIEPRPHPTAGSAVAVVIDNDFQDAEAPHFPTPQTTEDILHTIREAGIVGMGGAAFPGSVKALSAMGNVDTLIANACECEPYITADDVLLRTHSAQVLEGILILRRILHPRRTVLAVEDNKAQAIDRIRAHLKAYPDIELSVLPTRYPQGSEKQLIQALTGREVPPGQLPVRIGCAVFNVSTFAAIYRAVTLGTPLTRRIVTVSGEAIARPRNFMAPIGTPFRDLIEQAGGLTGQADRVISGGPMMGRALTDLSVPVVKATNAILCLPEDKNSATEHPICLRCAKCVSVCPVRLQPLYLYRFVNAGRLDELARLNLLDCMECGSCAFVCPGKLPLVERFRLGKKRLKEASAT